MVGWVRFLGSLRARFERAAAEQDVRFNHHMVVRLPEYWDWWTMSERLVPKDGVTDLAHECFVMRMYSVMRCEHDISIWGDEGVFRERLIEGERFHLYGERRTVERTMQLCHEAGACVPQAAWPKRTIVPFRHAAPQFHALFITSAEVWIRLVFETLRTVNEEWLIARYRNRMDDDDVQQWQGSWKGCRLHFDS